MPMKKGPTVLGRLAKASTDSDGRPIITVLATGPDEDKAGERCTEQFINQFAEIAKSGRVMLTPGHDVPFPVVAKSAGTHRDDHGHLHIEFAVDPADPVGMRAWDMVNKGELALGVSIGAEKVRRKMAADGKTVEIDELLSGDDDFGTHVALCFPGREMYSPAGVTGAIVKAATAAEGRDATELKKRGWSEEAIAKALVMEGSWEPPSFAERLASWRMYDEMPELLQCLQYTVEDILDPWTDGDKRAMLRRTFIEFEATVLGELDEADPANKAIKGLDTDAIEMVFGEMFQRVIGGQISSISDIRINGLSLEDLIESTAEAAVERALDAGADPREGADPEPEPEPDDEPGPEPAADPPEDPVDAEPQPEPGPEPTVKADTDPAKAPHTGCIDPAGDEPAAKSVAEQLEELKAKADELRNAIAKTPHGFRRNDLIEKHSALLIRMDRLRATTT